MPTAWLSLPFLPPLDPLFLQRSCGEGLQRRCRLVLATFLLNADEVLFQTDFILEKGEIGGEELPGVSWAGGRRVAERVAMGVVGDEAIGLPAHTPTHPKTQASTFRVCLLSMDRLKTRRKEEREALKSEFPERKRVTPK